MTLIARATALLGAAASGVALLAPPAGAHVSPDKSEVPAGGFTAVTLTVGHGCESSPTTSVAVQVPASILDVTPEVKGGWDIAVETETLPEPVEGAHGEQVTERDAVVTFTAQPGNELPDGFRTGFTLGFQAPDTPGDHLFFKTIQTCAEGETAWIEEFTGEGEEPEHPSPVVLVAEASDDAAAEEEPPAEDVDLASAAAVDDGGDDDGGAATGLAIAGVVAGLLGLALGGAAFARTRR